jgi:hypothetical protein
MQTPAPNPVVTVGKPSFVYRDPASGEDIAISTPLSGRELAALKARRSELSDQLQSVDGRRSKLLSQLKTTGDPRAVQGLEDRLALLDKRQLQLESDLASTGQQLSSTQAGLAATTGLASSTGLSAAQVTTISVFAIVFVLAPLAVGFMKSLLRRSAKSPVPPAALTETAERLERLETAVDTIAVEIERISEGQRFVTKLLSDSQSLSLPSGQRSPDSLRVGK